ncbi:MAG: four helix bundle protein [Bacteroidetes bacterium]|nr:four helix bundle protein [Bacteroidota bacterium]
MHNFKELKIWKKSRQITKEIYELTESFPSEERFGLISQMRRAAVSVVSNIAEGSGKESKKEFIRYLETSYSSAFEVETQLILAIDLHFISNEKAEHALTEITELQKMTYSFIKQLRIRS